MDLICKENENKIMEIPTEEFNKWLEENNVGWKVVPGIINCAMEMENCDNPHEPFSHTMMKKYDIDIIQCVYKETNGEKHKDSIIFQFQYYKHGTSYHKLLDEDKSDLSEYKNKVKSELEHNNINSQEASYILELVGLTLI